MNNNYKVFIFFLIVIFSVSTIVAQTTLVPASDLSKELKNKYQEKFEYKKEVYDRTLRFINDNLESPVLSALYFNLAEMSTEINVDNPSITSEFYQKVLEADSNFLNKDIVLYNIGFYGFKAEIDKRNQSRQNNIKLVMNWPDSLRLTEEKLEYAISSYKELTETFPKSTYYTEAYYRLGIIYFELALDARTPQKYFLKSVEYFDKVANQENDKLQNYGLFQRAWTNFSMGDFTNAIDDFTAILGIINTDSLEIETTFFEADALENIAFSLIEYDGTDFVQYSEAATQAKELFHSFVSDTYGKEILLKSVSLKQNYNAPMQAADLFNAYVTLYPGSVESPSMVDSIITIYQNNPNRTRKGVTAEDLIIDQYKRLTTEFRADSVWYQSNKEKEISNQLKIIKTAYEFLEPKYYNAFASTKSENNYIQYKELVDNYSKFDAFVTEDYTKKINKNIVDISQELAENSQDPRLYFETIENISSLIESNPDQPEIFSYQETRFYNYEKIYAILDSTIEQQNYIDISRNIDLDRSGLDSLYIFAINQYQNFLTSYKGENNQIEKELVKIIYNRAELYYNNEDYSNAFVDFEYVLQLQIDNDLKKVIYSRLAEISQNRNNYNDTERFYREAAKYATAEEKENFNNNILATIQTKAITYADSANYATAAQEYLRLAKELEITDPDKSVGFVVKAIESYQKAEQNQMAIDLYLEIASKKDNKNDALAAYLSAWSISDSLQDWTQSESLRKQFINKYKDSNEAYKLQLQIIGFYEGEQFNDKEKAAQMYMQLHENAANMDIGEDNNESIFLNAYRIYVDQGNENKIIELSLLFDKLYPDHPKSNDFLVNVAKIYNDRGEERKFEELATYLYKKDPTIDLLVKVAAEKLKEVNTEVDTFFVAEQYELMYEKINEFKELDKHYQDKGLKLPTDAIYDNFDYYDKYASFTDKFHKVIDDVYGGFLSKSPDELIKVNENTEWKKHLVEGSSRIPYLMELADKEKEKIIALIQEGNQYNLKTVDRTEALYVAAQAYYYSAEVVITQVQKYLDISNQLNNEQMNANPVQQEQYKNTILNSGNQLRLNFLKKAVQIYNTILTTFSENKDYSDEWIEKTYDRLVELGIQKPKIHEYYFTNNDWQVNRKPIDDLTQSQQNFGIWKNVSITSEQTVFDSANIIALTDTFETYIKNDIEVESKPELLYISYAFSQPLEIYINNSLVEKEAEMKKELTIVDGKLLPQYKLFTSKYLMSGKNSIIFKVPSDVSNKISDSFVAEFSLQYDEETYEYYKATELYTLNSDFTWLTKIILPEESQESNPDTLDNSENMADPTIVAVDSEAWLPASGSNFKYFKAQMYGLENSEAIDIWYPVIDSHNVETVLFHREIEIPGDVTDATLKCIGQSTIAIWINEQLIVENREIIIDDRMKKVQPFEYNVNQLVSGNNTIEIKVLGGEEFRGLIFEMKYRARKKLTE